MKYKKYLTPIAIAVVAFSLGRYSGPSKSEKTEKERSTQSNSETKDRNQNVSETIKETVLPDGTKIKEIVKTKETSTRTERESKEERERLSIEKSETRPSFRIGLGYQPAIKGFQEVHYALILEKRLFSELYAGVLVRSDKVGMLTVSLGF